LTSLEVRGRILAPLMGWYNTRPYSSRLGLPGWERATEIKGKWRWWMRVAAAPFFPNAGLSELDEKISHIMGSTSNPSPFTIKFEIPYLESIKRKYEEVVSSLEGVDDPGKARKKLAEKYRFWTSIPRIKVLLLRRRGEDAKHYIRRAAELLAPLLASPFNFRLTVEWEREGNEMEFARDVLFLYLLLDGVGALSNRGFGSIVPQRVEPGEYSRYIGSFSRIREFVDRVLEEGQAVFGRRPSDELLLSPSLARLDLMVSRHSWRSIPEALWQAGQITLRRELGRVDTWPLGLPRYSDFFKAGYLIDSEKGRRQSAISIKVVPFSSFYKLLVRGMWSNDWVIKSIKHRPSGRVANQSGYATYRRVWDAIRIRIGGAAL